MSAGNVRFRLGYVRPGCYHNPIFPSLADADLRRRSLVFLLLLMQEGLYEVGVTTNTRLDFSLLGLFRLKKEVEIGISPRIGTCYYLYSPPHHKNPRLSENVRQEF